jgi:hypothetical protein
VGKKTQLRRLQIAVESETLQPNGLWLYERPVWLLTQAQFEAICRGEKPRP